MRNEIPTPNPFLTSWFLSDECRDVMRSAGTVVRDLYRAIVAKDTGALAASARVDLTVGGVKHDRIVADVSVGHGLARGYGAAHEFGTKRVVEGPARPGREDKPVQSFGHHAANDFVKVLAIMDSMR